MSYRSFSFLTLLILALFPRIVTAQLRLNVGIYGGGTISSVFYHSNVERRSSLVTQSLIYESIKHDYQKPINTVYGGFVFPFKVGRSFSIRPSVQFFKKGWNVKYHTHNEIDSTVQSSDISSREYRANYVEVPVNLVYTAPLGIGRVYVGLGPYIAYALNGKVSNANETFPLQFKKYDEYIYQYTPNDHKPIQYITRYTFNRFDYGVNSVLGYEFPFGLFLEAKYDLGLREVSTSQERYSEQYKATIKDPSVRIRYSIFQLGVGLMINHQKSK